MKRKFRVFVVLLLDTMLLSTVVFAKPGLDDIEREAQAIMASYLEILPFEAHLIIKNNDSHVSLPNGEIILSRQDLKRLSKEKNFKLYLAILLGHEYGHQLGFHDHKTEMLSTSSCEIKTFYEAQADIVAGYLVGRMKNFYTTAAIQQGSPDDMNVALGFMYHIGDREFDLGTHPSFKQRRNAFRMGVAFAMFKYNGNTEIVRKIGATYRIGEYDSLSGWVVKMAKTICHNPNSALLDIKVDNQSDPKWHKTRDNPIVEFSQKFTNQGNKRVLLSIQYKVIGENRKNPDPFYADLVGDSKFFEFALDPGVTFVVTDSLNWKSVADSNYFPRLILPPDNDDDYLAQWQDGDAPLDNKCPQSFAFLAKATYPEMNFQDAIEKVNRESISNFQLMTVGFITAITPEFTEHASKFSFPRSESNDISVYKADGSINYEVGFKGTSAELKAMYRELKHTLMAMRGTDLKLKDDFSVYFEFDGTRTDFDKSDQVKVLDKWELVKRNDREESWSVEGVFASTGCEVELDLRHLVKYDTLDLNLRFVKKNN